MSDKERAKQYKAYVLTLQGRWLYLYHQRQLKRIASYDTSKPRENNVSKPPSPHGNIIEFKPPRR